MNKQQFLNELRTSLEGEVSGQTVYDNITYYDHYFEEQKSMGKSEEQIANELGKPSLIAKTIVDASDPSADSYYEEVYTEEEDGSFEPESNYHMVEIKWYHKVLAVVVVVAVVVLLLSIAGVFLSFAAPIILILLIIFLIRRWLL